MGSMSVGSSPFPGLLTRRDTGHMRNASSGAGFSNSTPASPESQAPALSGRNNCGDRSRVSPQASVGYSAYFRLVFTVRSAESFATNVAPLQFDCRPDGLVGV